MTNPTTSGCEIMRCTSYKDGKCFYDAPWCKYCAEEENARYLIAKRALGEISDRYYENPGNMEAMADDMRDIADSALRRLMLNNPHA